MVPGTPDNYLDAMGDGFLFDRVMRMASPRVPHALISIDGNREEMRGCTIALTSDGASVLAGSQNAVRLNGIDDWIGGVHLTSQTAVFRDGTRLI